MKLQQPAGDTGKFATRAERYCVAKFGEIKGNEAVFAALIISQAICTANNNLVEVLEDINNKLDEINDSINLSSVEKALEELIKAVDNVAHCL